MRCGRIAPDGLALTIVGAAHVGALALHARLSILTNANEVLADAQIAGSSGRINLIRSKFS
jgi:hypothetical protein